VHQAYRLGAADVIFKPIDPEVLRTKVRVFVELHRQQQTIQALLEEAESANRAKTAFLRMASHELRSPIAIALGYLSLLEDGTIAKPPEAWGRPLELVKAKVTQVARMANDMLEVARLEGGAIQPQAEAVNVAELAAREVGKLTSLAEQMSFSVTVSASPSSVWARADERHVARILEHLVQNALTYCRENRAVLVHTYEQGETVVIDVADKGIGIPPDLRERIFDPFFRVDDPSLQARPGTGLGLCIGRGLAECNGGHLVAATPEPGWQSCLRLTLPRSPALERIDVVNGNERGQDGATDKVPGHASVAAAKGWG
jgi:signal transduction histidine kinase